MGRPIKKRFFGDRSGELNSQVFDVAHNLTGTGGQQLASVTVNTAGGFVGLLPTASATPDLNVEGNTPATFLVHGKATNFATTANGTGYVPGDTLSMVGGTYSQQATVTVQAVTAVSATVGSGGANYNVGDRIYLSMGGQTTATCVILQVTAASGGVATAVSVVRGGSYTSIPSGNGGNNYNVAYQIPNTGTGTRNFTVQYGVYSFNAPAVQGNYTVVPSNPVSFTGGSGSGAQANVTYGVAGVDVVTGGSGYVNAAALVFSPAGSPAAAATGNLTNRAKTSLLVTAWAPFDNSGNPNTGGSAVAADIVKQESTRKYFVDTNNGKGACKLVAQPTGSLTIGQMNLIATDVSGNTYFVYKLTGRKAYLVQYNITNAPAAYANDSAVRWTIGSASTGIVSLAAD